jgi:hypothetical protein
LVAEVVTETEYSVVSPGTVEKKPQSCTAPTFSAKLAVEGISNVPAESKKRTRTHAMLIGNNNYQFLFG